jgi:lysophospholipase L1-like esterase
MARKKIEELDKNLALKPARRGDGMRWLRPGEARMAVRGLAWWEENEGRFYRLPLRAEGTVPAPVWELCQSTAGGQVAFRSDTPRLDVRVTTRAITHMAHMPLSASNGLALYAGAPGTLRYWGSAIPDQESPSFSRTLFEALPKKMREFRLHMPLYKELDDLELGVARGARILPPSPLALPRPVVFYGTSITQGGCASTAGSDFVSTVGRRLNLDVVNLGFSGNGLGHPEVAELMTEIDASLYVLDYAANVQAAEMRRTLPKFVRILQEGRPGTPILLITALCYATYDFNDATRERHEVTRDAIMEFYARQRRKGDRTIHLADGFDLMPFGADALTVDGGHPSEHGFQVMAERLIPHLSRILLRDH